MNKPVIYVVVNKSLGMSPGKLAAQVGHAVALCLAQTVAPYTAWLDAPHRWMIVLEADNGEQLHYIQEYLMDPARGVDVHQVIDEGVNEIPAFSLTALGVGPLDKDSSEATYLSDLKLYTGKDDFYRAFDVGAESRKWRHRVVSMNITEAAARRWGVNNWLKSVISWW